MVSSAIFIIYGPIVCKSLQCPWIKLAVDLEYRLPWNRNREISHELSKLMSIVYVNDFSTMCQLTIHTNVFTSWCSVVKRVSQVTPLVEGNISNMVLNRLTSIAWLPPRYAANLVGKDMKRYKEMVVNDVKYCSCNTVWNQHILPWNPSHANKTNVY